MTDTPSTARTARPLRPFARDPRRWEAERSRALLSGHICGGTTCTGACGPALVYERTEWGWLTWTVPGDGRLPRLPHQIGVLTPGATMTQRLAVRWLTRRSAHRIALAAGSPANLRLSAVITGVISLFAALYALSRGIPADLVLPVMLLVPLLTEHLPDRLDDRAREHVRSVEEPAACQCLQRLVALHDYLVQAAASSDRFELRRSAELGHNLLWDAAGLLRTEDTSSASARLLDRERLLAQLADQVAQTLKRTRAESRSGKSDQPRRSGEGPLGPLPPGFERATRPTSPSTPGTSLLKGIPPMPQNQTDDAARTTDTYLLFAHEPYYPDSGTQEINTTVVCAASLLHPQVRQPDGTWIHDRLTRGRQQGEIIPLSTLTHELDGGAAWPTVGDWETVTADLVDLVRMGKCDALSLGLPDVGRALVCAGPNSRVRAFDAAAGELVTYGPQERAAVLAEVEMFLTGLICEQAFWPGDGLLPPRFRQA